MHHVIGRCPLRHHQHRRRLHVLTADELTQSILPPLSPIPEHSTLPMTTSIVEHHPPPIIMRNVMDFMSTKTPTTSFLSNLSSLSLLCSLSVYMLFCCDFECGQLGEFGRTRYFVGARPFWTGTYFRRCFKGRIWIFAGPRPWTSPMATKSRRAVIWVFMDVF